MNDDELTELRDDLLTAIACMRVITNVPADDTDVATALVGISEAHSAANLLTIHMRRLNDHLGFNISEDE